MYEILHLVILAIFGLYIRLRQVYHAVFDRIFAVLFYHHRTPEWIRKDIQRLNKLPDHLSIILSLEDEGLAPSGLDGLLNDVGDIVAWCASAGIPMLSIYERRGVLKRCVPQAYQRIRATLHSYFGDTPYAPCPTISVRAANEPSYSPPTTPSTADDEVDPRRHHLNILLLSEDDGRSNLVDLTKTLATMAQQQKLNPDDITADVIEAEISESVMGEPDLLIIFGPRVILEGYPPWQVRLTEIL
jgi:dehydrodolichyl diphosphate syntase complex subunit NUS1